MKKYLKLSLCFTNHFPNCWLFYLLITSVIIDYQLQEVYLNQSLLFTAFYDSLLKVKIYKQGADSVRMKLIKLLQTCSDSHSHQGFKVVLVRLVAGVELY